MTEKEKALELISKYQNHAMLKDFDGMDFEIARGCALIGIDEMLNHVEVPSHIYKWLLGVKRELESIEDVSKFVARCGSCKQELTLVRHGKHQCDNENCPSNVC